MTSGSPVRLTRPADGYLRVTFDNPPINLLNPEMVTGIRDVLNMMETDESLKVVVFDSADEDFFMAHVDIARAREMPTEGAPTGLNYFADMVHRLSHAPVLSIAAVRGRARGAGNEFAMACDLRFASRERAVFGQPEIGAGALPGGGGMEALAVLTGRARALETVLSGLDYDAETAERYGWINRAVPDAELDGFVDEFAKRIARFDRDALVLGKKTLNVRSDMVDAEDVADSGRLFRAALATPAVQAKVATLIANGLQQRSDLELNYGDWLNREI